jgi:hypothetical protein
MLSGLRAGITQLRVFGSSLPQDRDVGVGVFPEGEEIFVGGDPRLSERDRPSPRELPKTRLPGYSPTSHVRAHSHAYLALKVLSSLGWR